MLLLIWGFILLLAVAVIFLIWVQFSNQNNALAATQMKAELEGKVLHLEDPVLIIRQLKLSQFHQQ